jgi:putative alpha-1,2-mannosidase
MSAWYIFSAMGFYPVNPVSGEYVVGSYEMVSPFPKKKSYLQTILQSTDLSLKESAST